MTLKSSSLITLSDNKLLVQLEQAVRDGPATSENVELRCRAHNIYEAEQKFGLALPWVRESRANYATRSGPS